MGTQLQPINLGSPGKDIESYLASVHSIPILTREQEQELAIKLYENDDLDAARQLVIHHLRFVVHIARSYQGDGLPFADIIQEGNVGLMKAVNKFDPHKGVKVVSFAVHWIKAEIQEFVVRNWRLVKTATTKAQRKLFFNLRSMKKTLQPLKKEEIKEIAKELNVKESDVKEMEYRFNGNEIALDYQDEDNEDEVFRPISYLQDENADPVKQLISKESESNNLSALSNAIKSIDERSRYVLESRWLNEEKSKTLHELADELGVSAERIRQIEQNALKK